MSDFQDQKDLTLLCEDEAVYDFHYENALLLESEEEGRGRKAFLLSRCYIGESGNAYSEGLLQQILDALASRRDRRFIFVLLADGVLLAENDEASAILRKAAEHEHQVIFCRSSCEHFNVEVSEDFVLRDEEEIAEILSSYEIVSLS